MKKTLVLALAAAALAGPAHARDDKSMITFSEVLEMPEAKDKLDGSIKFYLKGAPQPAIQQKLGEDMSNKKTNGVGKTDEQACKWAILSALVAFQESAQRKGANAVVDIVSYYKRDTEANGSTIECHSGNLMSGITLKGTYAKVR